MTALLLFWMHISSPLHASLLSEAPPFFPFFLFPNCASPYLPLNFMQYLAQQEKQWILKDAPPPSYALSPLPSLIKKILHLRGIHTKEQVERFLHPKLGQLADPFLLPNMPLAVERILQAVDNQENIVLYGDYDVDGITSLTLLHKVLTHYDLTPHLFLPHRVEEGYGISMDGLNRCLSQYTPSLLIAVDCGTSSVEEVAWLKNKGIEVIICDHHELTASAQPDCVALVNPKLGDTFHYLCSAGVVFKLAHALLKTRPHPSIDLKKLLDLVATATVADIVPLVEENRLLVRKGLEQFANTENLGLRHLKEIAHIHTKPSSLDIGFRIGPRLNASGRLDTARSSLDLLLATDENQSRLLAQQLDKHNRDRQTLEKHVYEQAKKMLSTQYQPETDYAIVLGSRDWHPGVVGIVASRLARAYHRPTIIVGFDDQGIGKGSGRSIEHVSLVDALCQCQNLLLKGGGHEKAIGLSIREEHFSDFQKKFTRCIRNAFCEEHFSPKLFIDLEICLDELNEQLFETYSLLEPFGCANPQPLFMARGITLDTEPRVLKEKHLKFRLKQHGYTQEAIYFNGAEKELPHPPWDVAFTIHHNHYQGRAYLQMIIESIRASA